MLSCALYFSCYVCQGGAKDFFQNTNLGSAIRHRESQPIFPFPSSAWLKLRLMTSSVSFFIFLRNPSPLPAPQTPHLNGLHEREEERPDADAAAEQLDEPGGAEEAEEADVDDLRGVHDAPHHRDEVERVPRVLEVRLREDREVGLELFGR